jgi:hypothetical protein
MNVIIQLLLAGLPEAPALIEDAVALFKSLFAKYPTMTQAQIAAVVVALSQQTDLSFLTELAKIAADQAATAAPQIKTGN